MKVPKRNEDAVRDVENARSVDAPADVSTIAPVIVRFVLLLICSGIVAQAGPLPACQWDEAIKSWTAHATTPSMPVCSVGGRIAPPVGNDTPDDILHDLVQQQSMGTVSTASALAHVHDLVGVILPWACLLATSAEPPLDVRVYQPQPSTCLPSLPTAARNLPLLI